MNKIKERLEVAIQAIVKEEKPTKDEVWELILAAKTAFTQGVGLGKKEIHDALDSSFEG